jgi:DUF1680 family protein
MIEPTGTSTTVAAVVPSTGTSRLTPLSATDVTFTGGFWAERAATNRSKTIPAGYRQLEAAGTLENFELAAKSARSGYRAIGIMFDTPFPFLDSDVYKWLEAAGWELGRGPDPTIREMADSAIRLVEAAQQEDGYLNTFVQVLRPDRAYRDLQWGHELYCIGHLIQAAIAWHRALGDDRLLLVAERAVASVERESGPDGRVGIDGHPEIEMALVELFRVTGERRYLDLAATFIDRRGQGLLGSGRFGRGYWQDHLQVREAPDVVGHAVRQLYLDCGAVDVAVELEDRALLDSVLHRWHDMVETRSYLTGALGSRHKDEAFGDPFELPPDRAYAETCAAIASAMLAWRLLLATGDPECADVFERTTYNAILPGLSADGTEYFYVNPLQRRTHRTWVQERDGSRQPWYACACCPPNLMRFVSSWQQAIATVDAGGVHIHQYATADIVAGDVRLAVETGYPWDGRVAVRIVATGERPWELSLRIPSWCRGATVSVGGGAATPVPTGEGPLRLGRTWSAGDSVVLELDMPARITQPHARVDAIRGCVALERGPLVYAIESADMAGGIEVEDVVLPANADPAPVARPDLGSSVVGLTVPGSSSRGPLDLQAIPYFTWANRGVGGMRVWIPEAPGS